MLFLVILFVVIFIYWKRRSQKKDYAVSTVPSNASHSASNKGL